MKATWSDSEDNSFEEDEEVGEMQNLCLMEKERGSNLKRGFTKRTREGFQKGIQEGQVNHLLQV